MSDMHDRRRSGALVLPFLMIYFGASYAQDGFPLLRDWAALPPRLAVCIVLLTLSGALMAVFGLWQLAVWGRSWLPLRLGSLPTVVSGLALTGGVLAKILPCSAPG